MITRIVWKSGLQPAQRHRDIRRHVRNCKRRRNCNKKSLDMSNLVMTAVQ